MFGKRQIGYRYLKSGKFLILNAIEMFPVSKEVGDPSSNVLWQNDRHLHSHAALFVLIQLSHLLVNLLAIKINMK